jgi:hypothetical protein
MTNAGDENWQALLRLLAPGWRDGALASGAIERLRGFTSPEALLRSLLLHAAHGYSLRETALRARSAGSAAVSDVALRERLRSSEAWLRAMCAALLRQKGMQVGESVGGGRLRIVDGTVAWGTRQDRQPVEDRVQSASARSGVRLL